MIQLGARQARYFGKTKTGFQIKLIATVANLMLIAAASGRASSNALIFALPVAMALLTIGWLADPARLLKLAPSRPGF